MAIFKFTPPIMNRSTKTFSITDDNDNKLGEMQRYFTFAGQNYLSMILNMAHVKVYDLSGETSFNFRERNLFKNLIFNKWDVTYSLNNNSDNNFELIDKTKIKTNQRLVYSIEGRDMEVKSEVLDRTTRFYKKNEGKLQLVAEVKYKELLPPFNYRIEIFNDNIHFCEIAGVYYLMQLNGSD